jgi:hypothetical protein
MQTGGRGTAVAVHRGLAVVFDEGPEHCGAADVAIEDGNGEQQVRYVQGRAACDRPPTDEDFWRQQRALNEPK